jgi:hypothetical protein
VDVEQLYLHGFQFVGHANTDPDANCHTDCHTDADSNCDCYTKTHPDSDSYTHPDTQ